MGEGSFAPHQLIKNKLKTFIENNKLIENGIRERDIGHSRQKQACANILWERLFIYMIRIQTIFKERSELSGIIASTGKYCLKPRILAQAQEEFTNTIFDYINKNFLEKIITFSLFSDIKGILWTDIRISKHSANKMMTMQSSSSVNIPLFIDILINIMRGDFSHTDRQYLSKICFCDSFFRKISISQYDYSDLGAMFTIYPKRIPLINTSTGEDNKIEYQMYGFKNMQYIEVSLLAKVSKQHIQARDDIIKHLESLRGDHDRFDSFLPKYILSHIPAEKRTQSAFDKVASIVNLLDDPSLDYYLYAPIKFQNLILEESFAKKYAYVDKRWRYDDEFENIKDKFKSVDEGLADQVQHEKGATQLLKLIKAIPALKFRLTPEQEIMISTPNNLLCLGRSGTGKTTSSALRLFSTDAYYKFIEEHKKYKNQHKEDGAPKFQIDVNFMDQPSNLRLVFVTASPVLTNEVKKFYNDMKANLKEQLQLHRSKKSPEKKDIESQVNEDQPIDQQQHQLNGVDSQNLEDYLELEKDAFIEEEELEKQLKLPYSIDHLTNEHYPLFATIKRFIYMIDASLDFSFFSRNFEGQIIGMESNVEWHNESKGVFMINQYFKHQKNYDDKIKRLGKELIKIDEQMETENIQNIDYQDDDDYQVIYEEKQYGANDNNTFNVSGAMSSFIQATTDDTSTFNIVNRQLSFEVDFDIFKQRFWPKVKQTTKLSPLVAWTEIYSVIKGGASAYFYSQCILPCYKYTEQVHTRAKGSTKGGNTFLTFLEKMQIYHIFYQYEQWKGQMNAYDFMDVVNHILKQTRLGFYKKSQKIQFLMVDEVQDLTPNILRLLMNMTERNVFFCGDTAQTIAKGVGFRFYDLKKVFQNKDIKVPNVIQLTKNFRSHSKILDLANSIISLIELIFPKTIDKLNKECSEIDGPKPIVIDPATNEGLLRQLLFSRTFANQTLSDISEQNEEGGQDKPQFGCNQVVIVRDQDSKARVPDFLQNMLCLTVYEAKGLEFDDVILFNFFEDSKCGSQWKLMIDVEFSTKQVKKFKEFQFIDFDNLDINEDDLDSFKEDSEKDKEEEKVQTVMSKTDQEVEIETSLKLKRERGEVYRKFAQLCTELKFLYVAITRPKKVLIIYDSDNRYRKPLQDFWQHLGLIELITKDMIQNPALLKPEVSHLLKQELNSSQATKKEWQLQGIMLFKKKFYLSAMQCFKNSHDNDLHIRCLAYMHADKAALLQGESEQKLMQSKNKAFRVSERNQYKKEASDMKKDAQKEMELAGNYFEQISMYKHAAQCYCSSKNLEKAAIMFENQQEYGQSAECFLKSGNLKKAAEWYAKAKLFANAFECFERLQDWEGLLLCLSRNKDFFKKEERESLVEKYFPIALNQLYQLYSNLDPMAENFGLTEENKGRLQEMRIKLKFQKSVSIIREEANEDDEDEEEEDDEDQNEEEKQEQLVEESKEEEEIQIIDTSSRSKKAIPDFQSEYSYQIIDEQDPSSEQVIATDNKQPDTVQLTQQEQSQADIEILSSLDPDDEFLQSHRSHSIIHSLIQDDNESMISIQSSGHASEFSIITNSKMHSIIKSVYSVVSNIGGNESIQSIDLQSQMSQGIQEGGSALNFVNNSRFSAIDNDRDMYAEDIVMQKIIFYISLFTEDVKERLKEMRSKDALGHLEVMENAPGDQFFDNQFMMIDLDNISVELLYLILDTLEHYELFRLCLIICNRYALKERIGHYLQSIGNKYSNLKQFKFRAIADPVTFEKTQSQQQQKYAIIAHEAMHNVLGMIEKSFLQIDDEGHDSIGLRQQCFDTLFLQGFWKKLVFLMDVDSALELCSALDDLESFKLLYLVYKCSLKDGNKITPLLQDYHKFNDFLYEHTNQSSMQSSILAHEMKITSEMAILNDHLKEMYAASKTNYRVPPHIKAFAQKCLKKVHQKDEESKSVGEEEVKKSERGKQKRDHQHKSLKKNKKIDYGMIKNSAMSIFTLVASFIQNKNRIANIFNVFSMSQLLDLQENLWHLFNIVFKIEKSAPDYHLSKIQLELKRIIYKSFGITPLDGYNTFDKFKNRYVLMRKDSCLSQFVQTKQQSEIYAFQNEVLYAIAKENENQFLDDQQLYNFVSQQYQKQIKDLEANQNVINHKLAFVCDLNYEQLMVPMEWVEDFIKIHTIDFCYSTLSQSFLQTTLTYSLQSQYLNALRNIKALTIKMSSPLMEQELQFQKHHSRILSIRKILRKLVTEKKPDPLINLLKHVLKQTSDDYNKMKAYFINSNKKTLCIDQSITLAPNDKKRTQELSNQVRSSLMDLCFEQLKQAMSQLGKAEEFYPQMIKAFNGFAYINEYPYLLEVINKQRKKLKNQLPKVPSKVLTKSEEKDQQLKNMYLLLDAHVYLKCNAWVSAVDSIYAFLNATVQKLNFPQILDFIESAFYRIIFNYYIYRVKKEQGVIIPDYAMIYLEPNSNYAPRPINQQKTLYEVQSMEYHKIYLQHVPDIKLISEAFYWCQLLVEALNKDDDRILNYQLYCRVYNMIIVLLLNSSKQELSQNEPLCKRVAQIAKDLHESPFDENMKECAYMRDKKNIPEQVEWAKNRALEKLFQLLKYDKEKPSLQQSGFVRLFSQSSSSYDKSMSMMFDTVITKAYYSEQALLAKHMAASNYICKVFRERGLIKKQSVVTKGSIDGANVALINKYKHYFETLYEIKVFNVESKKKIDECAFICAQACEKYDKIIIQATQLLQSKLVVNSLDLHYIKARFDNLSEKMNTLLSGIKKILFDKSHQNLLQMVSEVQNLAKSEMEAVSEEEKSLKEWLNKKADVNLIEIERKTLNMRSKWENLIQFQKRKKIMLRHLTKNTKK